MSLNTYHALVRALFSSLEITIQPSDEGAYALLVDGHLHVCSVPNGQPMYRARWMGRPSCGPNAHWLSWIRGSLKPGWSVSLMTPRPGLRHLIRKAHFSQLSIS